MVLLFVFVLRMRHAWTGLFEADVYTSSDDEVAVEAAAPVSASHNVLDIDHRSYQSILRTHYFLRSCLARAEAFFEMMTPVLCLTAFFMVVLFMVVVFFFMALAPAPKRPRPTATVSVAHGSG